MRKWNLAGILQSSIPGFLHAWVSSRVRREGAFFTCIPVVVQSALKTSNRLEYLGTSDKSFGTSLRRPINARSGLDGRRYLMSLAATTKYFLLGSCPHPCNLHTKLLIYSLFMWNKVNPLFCSEREQELLRGLCWAAETETQAGRQGADQR